MEDTHNDRINNSLDLEGYLDQCGYPPHVTQFLQEIGETLVEDSSFQKQIEIADLAASKVLVRPLIDTFPSLVAAVIVSTIRSSRKAVLLQQLIFLSHYELILGPEWAQYCPLPDMGIRITVGHWIAFTLGREGTSLSIIETVIRALGSRSLWKFTLWGYTGSQSYDPLTLNAIIENVGPIMRDDALSMAYAFAKTESPLSAQLETIILSS